MQVQRHIRTHLLCHQIAGVTHEEFDIMEFCRTICKYVIMDNILNYFNYCTCLTSDSELFRSFNESMSRATPNNSYLGATTTAHVSKLKKLKTKTMIFSKATVSKIFPTSKTIVATLKIHRFANSDL